MSTQLRSALRVSAALVLLMACTDSTAPSPQPAPPPGGLLVIDLDGGGSRLLEVSLADSSYREYLVHPVVLEFFTVLPDGSIIGSTSLEGPNRFIQVAPFTGEVIRDIPRPLVQTFVSRMDTDPAGRTITAFVVWFDNTGTTAINDIDLETGTFQQLFPALPSGVSSSIGVLRVHPDGDRVFASYRLADQAEHLLVHSRSRPTAPPDTIPLPAACTDVTNLQVVPDGRGLVFTCVGVQLGVLTVVALGLDGHPAPRIPEDLVATNLHFSPDGRFIAFMNAAVSGDKQRLWVLRLSDGARWAAPIAPKISAIVAWQ